jgi:hypothetical protein
MKLEQFRIFHVHQILQTRFTPILNSLYKINFLVLVNTRLKKDTRMYNYFSYSYFVFCVDTALQTDKWVTTFWADIWVNFYNNHEDHSTNLHGCQTLKSYSPYSLPFCMGSNTKESFHVRKQTTGNQLRQDIKVKRTADSEYTVPIN